MGAFVHPALLGPMYATLIAAVAAPVIIHLINMLRHRRVEWAAMEFLLLSQKKNRTWIVLKQLLLMLLRMAAMAAVVLMIARPLLKNQWGNLFGTSRTHHIVLLDDSFSMGDHWADTSAMAEAKETIRRLGKQAAAQPSAQVFTLLRFSRAAQGRQPDLIEQPIGQTEFLDRLEQTLEEIRCSQLAVGPQAALKAVEQWLGAAEGQRRIVYLVSDFRAREWDDPTDLRRMLRQLGAEGVELYLIDCVDQQRPNLAITDLQPGEGVRAAGVPFFMEVAVQNFDTQPARDVAVLLEEDGRSRPGVVIPHIPPGQVAKQRFLVHFPTAGGHQLVARLEPDALTADNSRFATLSLPAEVPVLLIDGDPQARDARYLSVALAPGGPVRTGLLPQIESPRYLELKALDRFGAIAVANVDRLDEAAVKRLEEFVRQGGGLAIFLGELARSKFITEQLYRGGEGLFPCPLHGPADLLVDRLERAPDLEPGDHFVFRVFADPRNNFAAAVIVERYFAVPAGWQPEADSGVRVIAHLRNGAPLVLEKTFGRGRVVAVLTTAAPSWNNWARQPSFAVSMLDLAAWLLGSQPAGEAVAVGAPLEVRLEASAYQRRVRFLPPAEQSAASATSQAQPTAEGTLKASFEATDAAGIYRVELAHLDGSAETRHFAVNVDPSEGDLAHLGAAELASRLTDVKYRYLRAGGFEYDVGDAAGYDLSEAMLYGLVVLLIGEQLLAYSAGYHPRAARRGAQGGSP